MGLFSGLGKIVKGVGGALPGIGTAVSIGSTALGLLGGAKDKNKAGKLQSGLTQRALARDKALQPLRDRAISLAMGPKPQRVQLGSIFSDSGNPYNRAGIGVSNLRAPQFAPQAPPAQPPISSPVQGPLLGRLQRGGFQ